MARLNHPLALLGILALVAVAPAAAQTQEPAQDQAPETQEPPSPVTQTPSEYLWSIEESLWHGTSIGEDYTLEVTGGLWNPTVSIVASSEQFGIIGTQINFSDDLGMIRKRHPELRLTFKPGRRHKLRLHWLPIQYNQSAVIERRIVFQGIAFDAGVGVDSSLGWDTWRFGYEFDIVSRERGYVGLIVEAKYTHIQAEFDSEVGYEFVRARAPIPALGAIARVYVTRFTPITAEFTAFRLPDKVVEGYEARYLDFDIYGTVNLSTMVGINVGYRSLDMSYLAERDTGDLKLDGVYLSGTFRF